MGDPDNEADDPWKGMEIERELKSREDPRERSDDNRPVAPDDDQPRRVRQRKDDND